MASVLDIPKGAIGHKHSMVQLVQTLRYKSWVRFPMGSLGFFIDMCIPPGCIVALGSTQPVTEMSTRDIF